MIITSNKNYKNDNRQSRTRSLSVRSRHRRRTRLPVSARWASGEPFRIFAALPLWGSPTHTQRIRGKGQNRANRAPSSGQFPLEVTLSNGVFRSQARTDSLVHDGRSLDRLRGQFTFPSIVIQA